MIKIGLLGGSFNPPHQGHIHISNISIKKLGLNQLWWIPTAYNPFKEKKIYESYSERLNKCQKITEFHPKIYIKKFDEIYTEKLIRKLRSRYKGVSFFWIMGADNLENFHKWEGFKKIISQISLVIVSRETKLRKIRKTRAWKFISPSKYKVFYTKNLDISSTAIRAKRKND